LEDKSVRTRLLMAVFCILALPFAFSPSKGNALSNSIPYSSVALAGHVYGSGAACECGSLNCICDPGERAMAGSQGHSRTSDKADKDADWTDSPISASA